MFAALASDSWSSTWSLLSDGVAILIIAVLLLLGAFLGYALRGLVGRWRAETIEKQMRLREEESESEIKAKLKEADIAARAAVVRAKEEFDVSAKKRRAELQSVEDRLSQRENMLDRRAEQLDEKVAAVEAKQAAVTAAAEKAAADAATADKRLKDLAKMTHEEARREILTRANAELRADAAILSRRIQEAAREQGETIAQRLVADAIQRCAVTHLNELATTAVQLPTPEMKGRIVGRDGRNVRAFEAAEAEEWDSFCSAVNDYWLAKKALDPGSTNPLVELIIARMAPWISAVSLCGAGGGGFMFVIARSEEAKAKIRATLENHPPIRTGRFFEFEVAK
jgi:chromosome segregation ATPase